MALYLHNTFSGSKERFEPADPERVTMYVCGPTVYSFPHIGNARPAVVFDVLARLLRRKYRLIYVRNITDVDDKINAAAKEEGIDINLLTSRYVAVYHQDMAALGVLSPDIEPRVTEHMFQIIDLIARLITSGHAYQTEEHVIFSVESYSEYGRLSGRNLAELIAGARIEVASYKRHPSDFVLWKPSGSDPVGWDSPWGRGRPGWHVECSAMVEAHLGHTIDIHGGGIDLVFPHHENENAQSACAHSGETFAKYWVHNGLIRVNSQKMAKSVSNVLLVRDLLKEASGEVIRLGLLSTHYRQPLDWTADVLTEAQKKLDRIYGVLRETEMMDAEEPPPAAELPEAVMRALEDDLNTPLALTELLALTREANRTTNPGRRRRIVELLRAGAWLLGIGQGDAKAWFSAGDNLQGLDEAAVDVLVNLREVARRAQNYAEADRIREELGEQGIIIEDGPQGVRWRRAR